MLAIISDLHLQHLGQDAIRHLQDGEVYLTRVARNIGASALQLWFAEIDARLARRRVDELHLVFAGDIFEVHRSPLWLTSAGESVRPTREDLGDDVAGNPLRERVHEILDAIADENAEVFAALRLFVGERTFLRDAAVHAVASDMPLQVHYVLGNHDRLLGAWPSTRRRVRELLSIEATGDAIAAPFPRYLDWPRTTGYGVRVRHGHEYDAWNFAVAPHGDASLQASPADYLRPTPGDFVTVDVATRIATAFRVRYAEDLRSAWPRGPRLRELYCGLLEFDDVRPAGLLMRYLAERLGASDADTLTALRPVLLEALTAAQHDPFFRRETRRIGSGAFFDGMRGWLVRQGLARLPASWLGRLVNWLAGRGAGASLAPADVAAREPGIAALGIDTIVAGHTHEPDEVPLGNERFFLDSGTWRTRIKAGVGDHFGRLRAMTLVFCYGEREREGGGRRFETWTGHLVPQDIGPRTEKLGPRGPAREQLRVRRIIAQRVDEGRSLGGAELQLRIGVDGEARSLRLDGVREGTAIEPVDVVIPIWRALDGELWATGVERDRGAAVIDPDDVLPWACQFLPRKGGADLGGAYEVGYHGAMHMRAADAHLVVEYELESTGAV